jgi:hypothetical protein
MIMNLVLYAGTAAARQYLYDLDLFAGTGVLDKMPDVDDAIGAGVGALKAGVMRLYGVVVILGGWVRVGWARLLCGHWDIPLLAWRSRFALDGAGASSLSVPTIIC